MAFALGKNATSKDPYHRFFSVHQPAKASSTLPPPPPPNPSDSSQPASLPDSCLISHKLVLPLTHFLFCFSLLLIPFSTCPLLPSISPWSSHFIFLPTNATQQSLKKCHFCLLLLFCNFFVSLLFSWEFIYRELFFCPQLSDLSVSVFLFVCLSVFVSDTPLFHSFLLPLLLSLLSFSRPCSKFGAIVKCHIGMNVRLCILAILWEDKSIKVQFAEIHANINYVCTCLFMAYCSTLSPLSINPDSILD